jgi:hypothetical protein
MSRWKVTITDTENDKTYNSEGDILIISVATKDKDGLIQTSTQQTLGQYEELTRVYTSVGAQIFRNFNKQVKKVKEESE